MGGATSFNDTFYTMYPDMNMFEYFLYSFGLLICPIVFILCVGWIYLIIRLEFYRFHTNFCILHLNLIIGFLYICIFHFFLCLVCILEGLIYPQKYLLHSKIAVVMTNFGATLLRCLWLAVFIERTTATVYRNFYENQSNVWISLGLVFLSYTISGLIEYSRWHIGVDLNYPQGFALILDFIAIVSLSFLSKYNRKLRQINARSDIKLTQRYQLAENIRALKILIPILRIGILFTMHGTILIWISFRIEMFLWAFRYTIMIYYTIFNIFICIAFVQWARKDISYREFFFKNWPMNNLFTLKARIRPTLVNFEGHTIPDNGSPDFHFATLRFIWEHG